MVVFTIGSSGEPPVLLRISDASIDLFGLRPGDAANTYDFLRRGTVVRDVPTSSYWNNIGFQLGSFTYMQRTNKFLLIVSIFQPF